MSDPELISPVVPASIETLIASFDAKGTALSLDEVKQAVSAARQKLDNPSSEENLGAWSEQLAFALVPSRGSLSPWGTYYGPLGSATKHDGTPVYLPDIAGTPASVILHWVNRAQNRRHPVLRARYADLAWDLARAIANANPDVSMARTAIDAYLESLDRSLIDDIHDRLGAAVRALDLAVSLRDRVRMTSSRAALLKTHAQAMQEGMGMWWVAPDRLLMDKRCELTDTQREGLVADLESIVARCSTTSDPNLFDPHSTKDAAERLIKHYNKRGLFDDVKRLHSSIATSFEHFASIADPMVASGASQTAVNAYRAAGRSDDSRRVRVLMEEQIVRSRECLKPIGYERAITREDMESFLSQVVVQDPAQTLAQIASEFVERHSAVEKQVSDLMEEHPLLATITQQIIAGRHVAATVGSVTDDFYGRLIQNAHQRMDIADIWLVHALMRAMEVHGFTAEHLASWASRTELFDDLTFLIEGFRAWFEQDYIKAVHVLVPQVEAGLRAIVLGLGKPVTKQHPNIDGASVAINMGDMLHSTDIAEALGPDITLYLQTLYSDPRGANLRNELAHGLLHADRIDLGLASRVVHTLLVFGVWSELAQSRRRSESAAAATPSSPR